MPKRWSIIEERVRKLELVKLYIKENKTIGEIARGLGLGESSVYQRLLRLGIKPIPFKKKTYKNINYNVIIPKIYSEKLAEMVGILLGDGHLTPTQVTVTLGKKDEYTGYISDLMTSLFNVKPKTSVTKEGHYIIYLGSARLVRWFLKMGLCFNKVKNQVDIPPWCIRRKNYMINTIRGLIDTDGSVYKLRFGTQISFCNRSLPLMKAVRTMLIRLGFKPSKISSHNIYLTRSGDLLKYYKEVGFNNKKHEKRFLEFDGRFG
ncbi:MAG: hypothetical protein HYT67_00450 [Candidatus Yanofskybacteria bacterium]|nr:hypothetical protein [Candidatus Yanofskybacteria bacterium]